jgi:hypothetical protein
VSQLHKAYVGLPSPPRMKIVRARYPFRLALLSDSSGSIMRSPVDIAAESRQSIVLSQTRAPPGRWTAPRWIAVRHCGI